MEQNPTEVDRPKTSFKSQQKENMNILLCLVAMNQHYNFSTALVTQVLSPTFYAAGELPLLM